MDLSSPKREKRLKLRYEGVGIAASHMMYVPIRIDQFEIVDSWMNEGKKCLVMQASYIDKSTGEISKCLIWTEAYKLIEDIKGTEQTLPHYTKISRNGRYMFYVQLN